MRPDAPKLWHRIRWRTLPRILAGYALAAASVAVATVVTLRIRPLMGESISPLYFAAVMLSAWYGGWGPALLATALAGWASAYYFLDNPPGSGPFALDDFIRLIVFLMVAVLISSLTSLRKRADRLLKASYGELERRVQERTAELREANELLRSSEERFRVLVEGVSDYAIVMLNAEGRVASWNAGAQRIFGYSHHEIIGKHLSQFVGADLADAAVQPLTLARKYGRHEDEGRRHRKDGTTFWANVITTGLRDASANLRGFAQVTRDITELRDLEREVLETSEAEQRRIGHDLHDGLGQELTGVAFLAQNLAHELLAEGSARTESAARIAGLANRSIELLRDVARGFSPVELGPDGLRAALHDMLQKLREVFGIATEFHCLGMLRLMDDAAALPLYRIAQEAVNNAMRHGKPTLIRVTLEEAGTELVLRIEDNGVGLCDVGRIGNGMGIRVMRYRAKMIGAVLDICSARCGGTIVTCHYPNLPAIEAVAAPYSEAGALSNDEEELVEPGERALA